jgi:nucleotide-binding universal stress UspA family protein
VGGRRRSESGSYEQAGLGCDPTYIVEQGVAAEKILDVAKRRHTHLIVLGARSAKRGLQRI